MPKATRFRARLAAKCRVCRKWIKEGDLIARYDRESFCHSRCHPDWEKECLTS